MRCSYASGTCGVTLGEAKVRASGLRETFRAKRFGVRQFSAALSFQRRVCGPTGLGHQQQWRLEQFVMRNYLLFAGPEVFNGDIGPFVSEDDYESRAELFRGLELLR